MQIVASEGHQRSMWRQNSVSVGLGSAGLVVLVVGTFLPWLRSGTAERNSYRAGAVLRHLRGVHGVESLGLRLWPFVGIWAAAVVIAYLLGRTGVAAGGALIAAAAGYAAAIGALRAKDNVFAAVRTTGPAVTILGASILVLAVTLWLLPSGQDEHGRSS